MKKMQYMHIIEYDIVLKKKETLPYVKRWMNTEDLT